jgi:hypothetical protein
MVAVGGVFGVTRSVASSLVTLPWPLPTRTRNRAPSSVSAVRESV